MNHQPPDFLAHKPGDSVAVAVRHLTPGSTTGTYLSAPDTIAVDVSTEIPLGHKIALTDISPGDDIIEYGVRIGVASAPIIKGEHVHVHNVRSARWQSSVA